MKMILLSTVLVLGLASCAHKGHHHKGCCKDKAEKSACSGTECATKKGDCGECAKKEEAAPAK